MKILLGGPARSISSPLFEAHARCLDHLRLPLGAKVDRLHLEDTSEADDYRVREGQNHVWRLSSYRRVAAMRQAFLDAAREGDYDYAMMVDTDLLLGPGVLEQLLEVPAPIVYGVFWTRWDGAPRPMPQVWQIHPRGLTHQALAGLDAGRCVEVGGGGACTLFSRPAMRIPYSPMMRWLPLEWGEDRGWCIRAEVAGLVQVAHGGTRIHHAYRAEDRTPEAIAAGLAWLEQEG